MKATKEKEIKDKIDKIEHMTDDEKAFRLLKKQMKRNIDVFKRLKDK